MWVGQDDEDDLRLAEILKLHTASAGLARHCDWSTPGFSVYRALCPNLPHPPPPIFGPLALPSSLFPLPPFRPFNSSIAIHCSIPVSALADLRFSRKIAVALPTTFI